MQSFSVLGARLSRLVRSSRVVGGAAWLMLSQILYRGSLIVAAMIVARELLTTDFAKYSYFTLTASMLATYAALGLGTSASKFFAEQSSNESPATAAKIKWVLLASVGLSVTVSVGVFVAPSQLVDADVGLSRSLLSLTVFLLAMNTMLAGAMRGLGEFRATAIVALVSSMLIVVFTAIAVTRNSLSAAMTGFAVSALTQFIGSAVVVLRRAGRWVRPWRLSTDVAVIKSVIDLALPMAINGALAGTGLWLLGRILLASGDGVHKFAVYSIGLHWFSLGLFIPVNVAGALLPRLIRSESVLKTDKAKKFLRMSVAAVVVVAIAIFIAGSVVAPYLIRFYGDEYAGDFWIIPTFLLAAVLASPVATLGNALLAVNGHWIRMCFMGAWLLVLGLAGQALVEQSEHAGALSLGIAYALLTLLMTVEAWRRKII